MGKKMHSRYRKRYYNSLSAARRRLRDRRIPRIALLNTAESPWKRLYQSGSDQAMITLTGLDFATFNWLSDLYTPIHDRCSPFIDKGGRIVPINNNTGRKRFVTGKDCLALSLAWTRSRGSNYTLQMLFGMTGTSLSMYLRFSRRILIYVLEQQDDAKIKIPSVDKINEFCDAYAAIHPSLGRVWCSMDGLKLTIQRPASNVIQNNYYNGWTHDHYITGVFCFCPDGTIAIASYNIPGSVHDSQIAEIGNIYKKLERVYELTGAKCTADSAFASSKGPYIIKSAQNPPPCNGNVAEYARLLRMHEEATSMRQSAEWGMRALQSSFPRLKDRIVYEEHGERKRIQRMMFLLFNIRARRVGINQIRNYYMPELERNANTLIHAYGN